MSRTGLSNCLIIFLVMLFFSPAVRHAPAQSTKPDALQTDTPDWARDAIWYQIFVERFWNGDPQNDPTFESIQGSYPIEFSPDWRTSRWTSDWYCNSERRTPADFYKNDVQTRRYGGDLQGVLDRLDYIESLGINSIYFNPLNDAPSLHKYDARSYRHIDVHFGPDPAGDRELIATENPVDPATWKWTSADKLFLKLIREIHRREMKLIIDYSWNHTGTTFWAWQDILEKGENSKFAHWYEIEKFDNPATAANELSYKGWLGVKTLPELKKVNVKNRVTGKPYSGNIHPDVKDHIFRVTRRWLDPNDDGDFSDGVDGFRLDVADHIGLDFWRDYRRFTRSINPETLLVGEIWWEQWPDKMMDPRPYVRKGDIFDIIMFYQVYRPAREFFAKTDTFGGAEQLIKGWNEATLGLPTRTLECMMMMSASHDSPRLLTSFQNKGQYKFKGDESRYRYGPPDDDTIKRAKLYTTWQFTMPGAPQIWAGDEMGMWGADDPDCRKPLWWPELEFDNESAAPHSSQSASYKVKFNQQLFAHYKALSQLRKSHDALRRGQLKILFARGDTVAYQRHSGTQRITIVINNSETKAEIPDSIDTSGTVLFEITNGKTLPIDSTNQRAVKTLDALSAIVIER